MKPPFPYYGGKTRIADQIVSLMPEHGHYVEPFMGALSVLLAKPPHAHETVNDLNGDLVNFFRVLRDHPEELIRLCRLTPHSRAEHAAARERSDDPMEQARRTFVLLSQGRGASLRRTGWAHFVNPSNMSATGGRPRYLRVMVERFEEIAERLLNVSIESRDGLEVIREYGAHEGVLLYVDPPYLAATRSSDGYALEFGREDQHADLLATVLACRSAVMLSGYAHAMYDDALLGWDRIEISARSQRGDRVEVLWSNRPFPSTLFDRSF